MNHNYFKITFSATLMFMTLFLGIVAAAAQQNQPEGAPLIFERALHIHWGQFKGNLSSIPLIRHVSLSFILCILNHVTRQIIV